MNSVWILLAVTLWMFLGYTIYGRFIEKRLKINDKNVTPAVKYRDNIDYSPAKKPFLVGHHFASIAGAGPIIGPILAISYFGWLPVILWVGIGSVFIGAMHDYVTLMASVRNKAKGVSNIAKNYLSSKGGWLFGLMIWITLMLITTVFSVSSAESIIDKPDLVVPLLSVTLIAVVLGLVVEKTKINYKLASAIAIIFVFISVWLGFKYPITLAISNPALLRNIWITIIFLYAGIASIIPIGMLLRPRDYLSSLQMSITLFLGIVAIAIIRPVINAPAYISSDIFPIWPILFITVACGAISGFHGLVSSGTTSKQLSKESDGRAIGYGGMLLEGLLATLVTIVAIAGLKWGSSFGAESFQLSFEKGWIVLFSTGFGNIVGQMEIPFITAGIAALLGAFMVNQFILTSVDTSTRLGRYVLSENLLPFMKNRFLTTIITLVPAWIIAVSNSYESLWRLFGSSNQLIAALSLLAVAAFFVSTKKNVKFILLPALFVLLTTLAALLYLTFRTGGYLQTGNYLLAALSLAMLLLGLFVGHDGLKAIVKNKKT